MRFSFDATQGLILVTTRLDGPSGHTFAILALDTGATSTLINVDVLVSIGYDPATAKERVHVTTGSGLEYAARLPIMQVSALGMEVREFGVIAHTLPPSAGVDGLLGLDFFRGHELFIDLVNGEIEVR